MSTPGKHAPVGTGLPPDAGQRLLRIAARAAGETVDTLLLPNKARSLARPRQAVMLVLHRGGMKHRAIARRMARDRDAVRWAVLRAPVLLASDAGFAALVETMTAAIAPAATPENES